MKTFKIVSTKKGDVEIFSIKAKVGFFGAWRIIHDGYTNYDLTENKRTSNSFLTYEEAEKYLFLEYDQGFGFHKDANVYEVVEVRMYY